MDYPLENLGPERFQELCQSLLVKENPGLQCFPVAQPDGGRDAMVFRRGTLKGKAAIYQVKFVRRPELTKDAHSWLLETIKGEFAKLAPIVTREADLYVLITNVPGTAHPDVGSIDLLNAFLGQSLPIPFQVWWRADVTRRLDTDWDLKWTYPDIMVGPDLLRALLESGLVEEQARRTSTVRAFLSDQYKADQEVKFKQVELQNNLIDLFVDVPISPPNHLSDRRTTNRAASVHAYIARNVTALPTELRDEVVQNFRDERLVIGAATLLLHPIFQREIPRIVLEGAPGQGKSTITQYICQVYRAQLLGKHDMVKLLPAAHKSGSARLPFRVDLRDLAAWLAKKDPFNPEAIGEPANWHHSLEAFLCAQIRYSSGGAEFSVSDLHAVLRVSAMLLVCDGLDEVAEVNRRHEVVDEITRSVARLTDMCLSLQVVVTSRPAAFANSAGPPEEKFPYFQLDSLHRGLIEEYSEKWLKAKRMNDREAAALRRLLREKLDQPHIKDLARNPMQLAILLSLMHTRGSSLPDKRTSLYDNYMDLFFNREAEKSQTVREHRDLLIGIHGYLAWLLQSEAQSGSQSGSISDERLRAVLRDYLLREGHDSGLVEQLFTGMVERVVALVSRVQGTYEFEVQPLREYFAARFLYETAPYSPAGAERKGTRPDRFDALSRDYYWLNVTRFYAGCFSKGELPALVDRLQELIAERTHRFTSHPRVLATMLLSDWVFAQHPKSVTAVVQLIVDGVGLRCVAAASGHRSGGSTTLTLPKSCGRGDLVSRAFELLKQLPPRDFALELIEVLRNNATVAELEPLWLAEAKAMEATVKSKWLEYGMYLGVLAKLSLVDLTALTGMAPGPEYLRILFSARREDLYAETAVNQSATVNAILDLDIRLKGRHGNLNPYEKLASCLETWKYSMAFSQPGPYPLISLWNGTGFETGWLNKNISDGARGEWVKVIEVVAQEVQRPAEHWATQLSPWNNLVECIRQVNPESWSAVVFACLAAGIRSYSEIEAHAELLFDAQVSICSRARYARLRAGQPAWWSRTIQSRSSTQDSMLGLMIVALWTSDKTLVTLAPELDMLTRELSEQEWSRVYKSLTSAFSYLSNLPTRQRPSTGVTGLPTSIGPRALSIYILRTHGAVRAEMYAGQLASYRGIDKGTLEASQAVALELIGSGKCDWDRELDTIAHSYAEGVIVDNIMMDRFRRNRQVNMPILVAERITAQAHQFPSLLVQVAQLACTRAATSGIVPVGVVADHEGWFDESKN